MTKVGAIFQFKMDMPQFVLAHFWRFHLCIRAWTQLGGVSRLRLSWLIGILIIFYCNPYKNLVGIIHNTPPEVEQFDPGKMVGLEDDSFPIGAGR